MIYIDFIGLVLTVCFIGLRYPHYVVLAILLQEVGQILVTVFLHGQITAISAAGAFGSAVVSNYDGNILGILIIFGGSLTNYVVSTIAGGIGLEPTANLFNSLARLRCPFAVINLRLALLSFVFSLWQLFWR